MARTYAERTQVPIERTRDEIERVLIRYGASQFLHGWDETPEHEKAVISFRMHDRQVQIRLPLPPKEPPLWFSRQQRANLIAKNEQTRRQRWRALLLVIKAKLEAVESGIVTLEEAFLADVVLPNRQRVGDWAAPQLEAAYRDGTVPPLLPAGRQE